MSLKAKITALSVAVTGTIIAALFIVQANNVVNSWLATTNDTAELVANHVRDLLILRLQHHFLTQQERKDVPQTWTNLLRSDRDFESLLEGTMAHARSVIAVSVSGTDGRIISASSPFLGGQQAEPLPQLEQLRNLGPFQRIFRLMRHPATYQVVMPLQLENQPGTLYTIQVVVSSALLSEDLRPALWSLLRWAVAGILSSMFLAWASTRLLAGNLIHISTALDKITRGEELKDWDHHDRLEGEFDAIESKLNVLGHQFRGAAQLRNALAKVLDSAREGVLLFGEDGTVTLAAGMAQQMLDIPVSELNGRHFEEIFAADTPSAAALRNSYQNGQTVREQPFESSAGGSAKRLIVSLDFSGRGETPTGKSALVRILDAGTHTDLESQIGLITKMDAMSRITSGVAHEIKNPLNALAVRLDNLQARAETEFPQAEVDISLIVREIERLDRVVRTFLDFTRPIEISSEWFSLTQLIKEIVGVLEPAAERQRIEMTFVHPHDAVWVRGDQDLLREGILNIATNAVEAMPNGGDLQLQLEQDGAQAHVTITDTGVGIDDSLREKVFHLYYTTKKDGSGLGLPMAFRAVQLHGGTLRFDSKPHRGTTFHVCLPNNVQSDATAA